MNCYVYSLINYDSSLYLYIESFIYKRMANSAHCGVTYFAYFSLSMSHSDVIYFKNRDKKKDFFLSV